MITVRGENPETVQLLDINDFIYYKQIKTFSEEDYNKSNSLQRAISKGSVIVLKRVDERFGNFESPQATQNKTQAAPENASDNSSLMELLKSIELKLEQSSSPNNASTDILIQKIEALESRLQGVGSSGNESLLDTIKKLEEKINENNSNSQTFAKLEELMSKLSGLAPKSASTVQATPDIVEEVYVPNIKVEDGNSHINLKVRTIESSDNINSAFEALRKIKKPT